LVLDTIPSSNIFTPKNEEERTQSKRIYGEYAEAKRSSESELRRIYSICGWPTISRAGEQASTAAWLVLQHAPASFQIELLPTLLTLAELGEAGKKDVARLYDRVQAGKNLPQRFGTSYTTTEHKASLDPVEDLANLDLRRAALGLPPICNDLKGFAAEDFARMCLSPQAQQE